MKRDQILPYVLWAVVIVGLGYGLSQTIIKAATLFTAS